MAKKRTSKYVCQACGYESPRWLGRCPNCGAWNQMEEERIGGRDIVHPDHRPGAGNHNKPQKIGAVSSQTEERIQTGLAELNRVLGGGVVAGSLVLIGGDPGIGKSTLLLQVSMQLSQIGGTVLYISGEESTQQIKLRADRLGMAGADFYVFAETNMDEIKAWIRELKPDYVVIDSVQTMHNEDSTGVAGSVSQVRETTAELMRIAKGDNIAIFIVGHVTKEGNIAGPRILEHMVDTVLYFEGEKHNTFRILRAVKNRFGSTNEIGVFDMQSSGLVEVANPSQLFLEERLAGTNGSAVVSSMEGSRPILTEIQALLTATAFGNARRTASGLDYSRVTLIMAVLEKRAGLMLQNQDAYLKSTGGVRLDEPAIDLAIAVAIASSYWEKETQASDCFVGEIGLTGEIRRVSRIADRIQEAERLGFERIFIPKGNLDGLEHFDKIKVLGVTTLREVLQTIFPR
ncbi:DNA repair protein RadA [Aerococcus urinaehominis]|uniref:DNA repair protein RadA n=1 Tax=Aerococcus urinaehominis TaxID=128944 RepID=A0A109RH07_9LACT|nr:DNA repair protein RadA [Aerococcus urinaehominis]AMB99291.1 DNA repair protein RadA [Aerococcus urinaehominis]SDM19166.1 DNA repair protein RadA/Sms [Aerococcus urinaehominis]